MPKLEIPDFSACAQAHTVKKRHGGGPNVPLRGEHAAGAKLSTKAVLTIRRLYSQGVPIWLLAERFNVTRQTISNIVAGRRRDVG